jgi:hypothetical protein
MSALARLTYFGDNVNQGMRLPGYLSLDVTATWQITRAYLAVVRGTDLTRDVGPQTRPGVFGPGRVVSLIVQGSFD